MKNKANDSECQQNSATAISVRQNPIDDDSGWLLTAGGRRSSASKRRMAQEVPLCFNSQSCRH